MGQQIITTSNDQYMVTGVQDRDELVREAYVLRGHGASFQATLDAVLAKGVPENIARNIVAQADAQRDGLKTLEPTHNAEGKTLHYTDADGQPLVPESEPGMTTDEASQKGIEL